MTALSHQYLALVHSIMEGTWPEWAERFTYLKRLAALQMSCSSSLKGHDASAIWGYKRPGPGLRSSSCSPISHRAQRLTQSVTRLSELCRVCSSLWSKHFETNDTICGPQDNGFPPRCLHPSQKNLVFY